MNAHPLTAPESSEATAERVWRHLDALADEADRTVAVSVRELGDALGIGRNTAHTALRRLSRRGVVLLLSSGTGNRYPAVYEVTQSPPAHMSAKHCARDRRRDRKVGAAS